MLALALVAVPAIADELRGAGRVTAADTIVVHNARIRLDGVAAEPERAKARLGELVAAGDVTCERRARLGHGVYAGSCRLADGRDAARALREERLLAPPP